MVQRCSRVGRVPGTEEGAQLKAVYRLAGLGFIGETGASSQTLYQGYLWRCRQGVCEGTAAPKGQASAPGFLRQRGGGSSLAGHGKCIACIANLNTCFICRGAHLSPLHWQKLKLGAKLMLSRRRPGWEITAEVSTRQMLMWYLACAPTAKYTITTAKTPCPEWTKAPISLVHRVPHPHSTVTHSVPTGPTAFALAPAPLSKGPCIMHPAR